MQSINRIKQHKRSIVQQFARPNNVKGLTQVLTTLLPLALLWWAMVESAQVSYGLAVAFILPISLFLLRVFALMHDCGHGSLFRSDWLNQAFGYVFGVISGMPQYVWAQHHHHHHKTNGNWSQYRGPLDIRSVAEYGAMTGRQQRHYRRVRNIWLAPFAGFLYLIFNPRLTWLKGSISLVSHIIQHKLAQPERSFKKHAATFETPYWNSRQEYWHMFWNNVVLLSGWGVLAWTIGPVLFFSVYLVSLSLAGGAGIVLFTVQHNFEHSYASDDAGWDYDEAAIHGSSYLILPRWLNWFTVDIAYHHIHHLSAKIPNYRLADCHAQHAHLFGGVVHIGLDHICQALKFILWDPHSRRIISVAEYDVSAQQPA